MELVSKQCHATYAEIMCWRHFTKAIYSQHT